MLPPVWVKSLSCVLARALVCTAASGAARPVNSPCSVCDPAGSQRAEGISLENAFGAVLAAGAPADRPASASEAWRSGQVYSATH